MGTSIQWLSSLLKMKLAFALFTYFPYGGLTRDLIDIARMCRERGHEVRVYAADYRSNTMQDDLELRLLPPGKAWTNHTKNRVFAKQLKNAVADFSPNLLVGFNKMPGLDVYYAADPCFAEKIASRSCWYRMTPRCRHFLAFEQAVFSPTSSTETLLLAPRTLRIYREFYELPETRMTLLPPGISRDRIATQDAPMRRKHFRAQWGLADSERLLLAVGSGFRTKGLDRTLKAVASLPLALRNRTHLFVIGDDKAAPFEKIARHLGIRSRVQFLHGRDDVPEFLFGADLLMHPAYHENTGTVLLEAMVAGLPVLSTDVCGYADYINNAKMGEVLASPFAQTAFNNALARLIEAERNSWCTRGHDFAQNADIYDMPLHACKRLETIWQQRQSNTATTTP